MAALEPLSTIQNTRTGFPVDPDAAVEQLKARLSAAFDRFLEGVADNRLVV